MKKRKMPQGIPGSVRYEARMAGFRSGFERTIDTQLRAACVKYAYEDTEIPYTLDCTYHPDFRLLKSNIIIETKGVLSDEDRRKHLALKKQRPDLDIRFVFMRADTKIPRLKCTHAQWATRNGFKYGDGRIPEEWFDE